MCHVITAHQLMILVVAAFSQHIIINRVAGIEKGVTDMISSPRITDIGQSRDLQLRRITVVIKLVQDVTSRLQRTD